MGTVDGMSSRIGLVVLAIAFFLAGLIGLGDVEPVQLVAIGGIAVAVAIVIPDRDRRIS